MNRCSCHPNTWKHGHTDECELDGGGRGTRNTASSAVVIGETDPTDAGAGGENHDYRKGARRAVERRGDYVRADARRAESGVLLPRVPAKPRAAKTNDSSRGAVVAGAKG